MIDGSKTSLVATSPCHLFHELVIKSVVPCDNQRCSKPTDPSLTDLLSRHHHGLIWYCRAVCPAGCPVDHSENIFVATRCTAEWPHMIHMEVLHTTHLYL